MTALVFDCDGVLADTERHGHLPAFNETFAEYGLAARWSEQDYAEKLKIGGGKERMASMFDDAVDRTEQLRQWHRTKTAIFKRLVAVSDVLVSNHPIHMNATEKQALIRYGAAGEQNPYVYGTERYQRFMQVMEACSRVQLARLGETVD